MREAPVVPPYLALIHYYSLVVAPFLSVVLYTRFSRLMDGWLRIRVWASLGKSRLVIHVLDIKPIFACVHMLYLCVVFFLFLFPCLFVSAPRRPPSVYGWLGPYVS